MSTCEHCSGAVRDGVCGNCGAPSLAPPDAPAPPSPASVDEAREKLAAALRELVAAAGEEVEPEAAELGATALEGLVIGYACDMEALLGEPSFSGTAAVHRRTTGLCRCCLTPLELDVRVAMRATQPARIVVDDLATVIDALGHRLIRPASLADQIASLVVDVAGAATAEVHVEILRPCLGCGDTGGTVHVTREGSWPHVAAAPAAS